MPDIIRLGLNEPSSANNDLLTATSLPLPHTPLNNVWYVNGTSDTVIVFVHGIFSDCRNCWLYSERKSGRRVFWPDLVRTDPRFNNPSIFLAGFETKLNSGDFALADCATEVFNALEREGIDGAPPVLSFGSIIFIGHSTGGIIARYLVERNQDVFTQKAVGFALLASPSLGSRWANLAAVIARICNQRLGLQLRVGSEALQELDGRFRDLVDRKAKLMPLLFGMEACEQKFIFRNAPVRWLLFAWTNRAKVVTKLSAGCYFGRVTEIPGTDHFSIVKPDGFGHPSHDFLVTFQSRFSRFLTDNGFLEPPSLMPEQHLNASGIRHSLLSAKSIHDLEVCRANAVAALEKAPHDADLILLHRQIEDALAREKASKHRSKLLLLQSGSSLVIVLVALIAAFFTTWRLPNVTITSISTNPVAGESPAIVSGMVTHANNQSSVYVLYKSAPDVWTATKAQVATNGSWVANLGRWNDVTNETSPSSAEVKVIVTEKPLEEQNIGTAGNGVFLIPDSQLHEVVGKQSEPVRVEVKPIVEGEGLIITGPHTGSEVRADKPFFVIGVANSSVGCVYLLHRTPQMGVWAAHRADVYPDGHWIAALGSWNDHELIHSGINELIVISVKRQYCGWSGPIKDGDVERISLSKSPIVRIIVNK